MTQSSKEEALKKWAPIIESMGVTGSKADWMSQYVEMHSINESNSQIQQPSVFDQTSNFPSILPVAKRIFAKTVGLDLVAVRPPGGNSTDDIDRIEKEVKSENRDRKIDAITDDKEFEEMKVEDHPEYKDGLPKGNLFYMDYQYGSTPTHKKTRRSKKK